MSLKNDLKNKISEIKEIIKDDKFYEEIKDEVKENIEKLKTTIEEYSEKITRKRGFEVVSDTFRKFPSQEILLPLRGSRFSAGYDLYSNETIEIQPGKQYLFWMDVKAYMNEGEVLELYPRSSIGINKGLNLANTVGIIDMDYYQNVKNDGNLGVCLKNTSSVPVVVEKGERIAQAIFKEFLVSDNCNSEEERKGGIGSTNK